MTASSVAKSMWSMRPGLVWAGLAVLAFAISALVVVRHQAAAPSELRDLILAYAIAPRMAIALVAGASLGLCGMILQRVLRNPLAEPSTLGISAGAQLALTAATIHAPALLAASRTGVALAGSSAVVLLLVSINIRRGFEPVSLALTGMLLSLAATMGSAGLILANGDYMFSLFVWGGGSLVQQSWSATLWLLPNLALVAAAAFLLVRPLDLMSLDDSAARGLGLALGAVRFGLIGASVWLAATVTAHVGIIGFVGLAAPALARLSGARRVRSLAAASMGIGAVLLWLTDGILQLASTGDGERIPAGAATALLGGPLLLWLLPRLRLIEWPQLTAAVAAGRRSVAPRRPLAALALGLLLALALGLSLGRGPDGWQLATGDLFSDLLAWRLPRVAAAMAAGAMLAAAGFLMQKLTANPLASPEILGVGSGAGVGLAAVLYVAPAAGMLGMFAGSALGATGTLVLLLIVAAGGRFGPERLLLGGIAAGAAAGAVLTAVIAMGNMQSYALLRWLSGSTNDVTLEQAAMALGAALVLIAPLPLASRVLALLPLGDQTSTALGLRTARARLAVIALACLLTAAAALVVGPLSFIGLIAPHVARGLGLRRPVEGLAGSVLAGAMVMVVADLLARNVAFPYHLPLGLFATLLAAPYLVWSLGRR